MWEKIMPVVVGILIVIVIFLWIKEASDTHTTLLARNAELREHVCGLYVDVGKLALSEEKLVIFDFQELAMLLGTGPLYAGDIEAAWIIDLCGMNVEAD